MMVHGGTGRWCWVGVLLLLAGCATVKPRPNASKASAVRSGFELDALQPEQVEEDGRQAEAKSQVQSYIEDLAAAAPGGDPVHQPTPTDSPSNPRQNPAQQDDRAEAASALLELPVVRGLSVVAVTDPQPPERPVTSANTPAGAGLGSQPHAAGRDIEHLQQRIAANPGDIRARLKLRYLYLSEGLTDKALAVPENLDPERAEVLLKLMKSAVAAEQALADPGDPSAEVLNDLGLLQTWAESKAALEIPRLALCASIHSYGRFDPVPADFFTAGALEPFLLYCELQHFSSEQTADGQYQTRIGHRVELFSAGGQSVWKDDQDMHIQDTCLNRRRDFFFNRLMSLPEDLGPGPYVLKITVEDRIGRQTTEASLPLEIKPSGLARRG